MRRTDEAFKSELFRRYGQYKKNRRNLYLLAAAPGAVSIGLVCLLLLPQFVPLGQGKEEMQTTVVENHAAFDQPTVTTAAATTAVADEEPESSDDSPYDGDDGDDGDETLPSITEEEMQALVEAGGTFHDLIDRIGNPHTSITSGLYTPAWYLADGRMLIVQIELNELSTPIPIEGYTFCVSPMLSIVEMLEYCNIGNITVTEGHADNAAFYRSYTDQTNIEAIRELIYDCTRLSVMSSPTEVDPATVDLLQGTCRVFQLNCTPAPGFYADLELFYTVTLLDAPNGLFFGYDDLNDRSPVTRWFKISPEPFNALWNYVETHGENEDDGTVKENPFYGITNNPIHTVTVTEPYGTHIYKDDEAIRLVKLLDQLTSNVYREAIIDNMDGITFYIEIDWTPEPDATGAIPDEYSRCTLELFGGGFLRAPDYGIEEWYEIDEDAAEALMTALNDFSTSETLPLSPLDLPYLLDTIEVNQIQATVQTYYSNSRIIEKREEIETVVYELISLTRSIKENDICNPSFSFTGRLYTIVLEDKAQSYTIELHEDGYIRCSDGKTVSDWFEIDYAFGDPFPALGVDLSTSVVPSFAGFDGGRLLLHNIDTNSVTVKSGDSESVYSGTIIDILIALDSLLEADGIRADQSHVNSLGGKDMLTIILSGSYKPLYPGYVIPDVVLEYSYELAGGKYLRYANDFEVSEWYEIDEKAAQKLLDVLNHQTEPEKTPADNPIKAVLRELDITSVHIMMTPAEVIASTGYHLYEHHSGYIVPLTDQLYSLTLTECDLQNITAYDALIVIKHSGLVDPNTDLVYDTVSIALGGGHYLNPDVTSEQSRWYEIPQWQADELLGLLEKIRADME